MSTSACHVFELTLYHVFDSLVAGSVVPDDIVGHSMHMSHHNNVNINYV